MKFPTAWTLAGFLLFAPWLSAQAPRITKVEPPNWFAGLPSPMLLVYGEGLGEIQAKTSLLNVKVDRVDSDASGHYAFVWLDTKAALPGPVNLTLSNAGGSVTVPFQLVARRKAQDGMQGFSHDDIFYLAGSEGSGEKTLAGNLDRLKDSGITTVVTPPIFDDGSASAPDYGAYGATDLYRTNQRLGSMRDLQTMVSAAHQQKMKVLFDLTFNQIGPGHDWATQPPQPNWLHGTAERHFVAPAPLDPLTNPHASAAQWKPAVEGWFDNLLPDLNQENPRVSQYLIQNAIWWIENTGVDGFRLEQLPYAGRAFWHDFDRQIHQLYPRFKLAGDVADSSPAVTSFFAGGTPRFDDIDSGVDTLFDFPLYLALRDVVLKDAPISRLSEILRGDRMYPHPENLITFLDRFDAPRFASQSGATPEKVKLALSILATLRGAPQLAGGNEVMEPAAEKSANGQEDIAARVRQLARLRQQHIALREGKLYDLAVDDKTYAYARVYLGGVGGFQAAKPENLLIVANNSDQPQKLTLQIADTPLELAQAIHELLPGISANLGKGSIEVEVGPRSLAMYVVDCGCDVP